MQVAIDVEKHTVCDCCWQAINIMKKEQNERCELYLVYELLYKCVYFKLCLTIDAPITFI